MDQATTIKCDGPAECANEKGNAGFILPLTLWMIAIIGLLATTINAWVATAVANAGALARRTELELAQSNIRNELVYMLGTRPISYRGLEIGPQSTVDNANDYNTIMAGPSDSGRYLRFDGRPYSAESDPDTVVMVQDGTGLLNLNIIISPNLRRALTTFDIPEPQINRLIDTLLDYIDDDQLTRLAGAEKTEYARLGKASPTNGLLVTPLEAQRVMGWDQLSALWEADLGTPLLTTCQAAGFNPNTAPPVALIASVRGLTQDKADKALAAREVRPFRNVREFGAAADLLITDEPFFYSFIPGRCVIVDMIDKRSGQHARFSLTLDPLSQTRPWRVDYAIKIPAHYRSALDRLDPEAIFPTPESMDLSPGPDDGKAKLQ